MPGFCWSEPSVGGSLQIGRLRVPISGAAIDRDGRKKAAMYSKHFHLATNQDQAHEICVPLGAGEGARFRFPLPILSGARSNMGRQLGRPDLSGTLNLSDAERTLTPAPTKGRRRGGVVTGSGACLKILILTRF